MKKKLKDLVDGECYRLDGANVIACADGYPKDLPKSDPLIHWQWLPLKSIGHSSSNSFHANPENEVTLIPSYRSWEGQLQAITFNTVGSVVISNTKKVKDLKIGDCFKSFLSPGILVMVAESFPSDMDTSKWTWSRPGAYTNEQERTVDLVPSYRKNSFSTPGQIFSHMAPMPPKKETFNGLTAAECLIIYQSGMQSERVRTDKKSGRKYIAAAWAIASGVHLTPSQDPKDPLAGLSTLQFTAAQAEFSRLVREKAAEAKKIKTENETVLVQRDVDYFNE